MRSIDPGLVMVVCGSYRRGKPTCGDVDVLITHPDGSSHVGVFNKVLNKLHEDGQCYRHIIHTHDKGHLGVVNVTCAWFVTLTNVKCHLHIVNDTAGMPFLVFPRATPLADGICEILMSSK